MPEAVKVAIRCPRALYGSEEYIATVEVTNLRDKALGGIAVEPQLVPGTVVITQEAATSSEPDALEDQKRTLVTELEEQLARAYERTRVRELNPAQRVALAYARIPDVITAMLTGTRPRIFPIPYWAKEACRIRDWDDVIRLEKDIMNGEKEDSFLRRVFLIDKEKLERLLHQIANNAPSPAQMDLAQGITIQPGDTVAFPFTCRAPHLYRPRDLDMRFRITYRDPEKGTQGYQTIADTYTFYASSFAPPLGAVLGAVGGYLIKAALIAPVQWFSGTFWTQLLASVLLALVVAAAAARSSEAKKSVTKRLKTSLVALSSERCRAFSPTDSWSISRALCQQEVLRPVPNELRIVLEQVS